MHSTSDSHFQLLPKISQFFSDLSSNSISWTGEEARNVFIGLDRLSKLNLRGNNIRSIPVELFSGCSQLRSLDLRDNSISSVQENAFQELFLLKEL